MSSPEESESSTPTALILANELKSWVSSLPLEGPMVEWKYRGHTRKCFCSLKAPRYTVWVTDVNPGRRYFGCRNWNGKETDGDNCCRCFEWFDGEFSPRAVEVIRVLRNERNSLFVALKCARQSDERKAVEVIELGQALYSAKLKIVELRKTKSSL